jgi:hypothetical protein
MRTIFCLVKFKEKEHPVNLGVDMRIILKFDRGEIRCRHVY